MSIPQDASDRDFFRSNPHRDHRVRRASAAEIAWARIMPEDVPKGCVPYAAICRNEPARWLATVFVAPAKLKTKPGREESTAQYCFVNAALRVGSFRPEPIN